MSTRFSEELLVFPVYNVTVAAAGAGDDFVSEYVDMLEFTELEFLVHIGTIDSSAGSAAILNVLCSSTVTAAGAGTAFSYRLTPSAAGSSYGAITNVVSSDTLTLTSDDNGKICIVHVRPSDVNAIGTDKRYVYINMDVSTADNATYGFAISAIGLPRHKGNTPRTTTA